MAVGRSWSATSPGRAQPSSAVPPDIQQAAAADQGGRQGTAGGIGRRRPVSAPDDRDQPRAAGARDRGRERLQRHLDGPRPARNRRPADDHRVRRGPGQAARRSHPARRPIGHRHGGAGRRFQGNPEAARRRSTSCFSMRGSATTRRSSTWCCPASTSRGLFLGHNVVNKRSEMGDFLDAIHANPAVLTTIVSPSGEGMSVSLKLR